MENKNKIALITGGSRGLGKESALRLAEKGIDVIITYHSRKEDAEKVVARIEQIGQKSAALQLNVGDTKTFDQFFTRLKEVLQTDFDTDRFDFLINNGGGSGNAPFAETTEEMFDSLLNDHFKGVYFLTQKALGLLNDKGGIVNVTATLSRLSLPNYSAYSSIKGATEILTRYLAAELGPRGIRANIVAPGAVATDFGGGHVRDNDQLRQFVSSQTALGRVGVPEDIGGVVAFLCTEDARWINAQRIEVSGGMRL